ncbi:fimbria/pilus outer membrane usher protein [Bdellovibrio svalbardensis]|uniref:Fimbria/pilus outer membrane usher protein n=1 Tax=Bdellovibrio svalbardensis TaxID=2972972 RepID=A0ABT6DD28_9BACT|nr:fimbria/pilus outer membrane usher protein [Bdellovibrio svalbardensis]MDG0814750.1 fimbria/pilus outer membrane usher protein [Bdellovibrio svalbardensis]
MFLSSLAAQAVGPRPALAKPYVVAPIVIDGAVIEEAWIFPRDTDRDFSIEAEPLLQVLQMRMKEDLFANLKQKVTSERVITMRDLKASGVSAYFNDANLELRLDLPLKYRRSNDVDLNYFDDGNQKYLRPSQQSGYLNFRFNQSYQYGSLNTENKKLPLSGHVDFVENIHGFVLESMADYLEQDDHPWKRQDTRLRWDDEQRMNRYTLGDLTLTSRGFQMAPNMAGFSLVREFGIQPYKTLRPLSSTEIVIKRPSQVEVYVNGFMYSQMRLAPGVFNIRDFPLAIGQNNVKVKVRDNFGQEEIYDFSVLFENSILPKGVQEFSYGAGAPWTESGADRAYVKDAVFANAFHRVGLSDELTVGFNYQNYLSQSLTGVEASGITNWGYLSADVAYSAQTSSQKGYAEKFRYRTLDRMAGVDMPVTLTLESENHDQDFNPVSANNLVPSTFLRRYDGQLNFRPGSYWTIGIGGSYLEQRNTADQRLYRANVIFPLAGNCRVEVSYNKVVDNAVDDRGYISFFWNELQGRYSASSFYDSQQKNSNVTLSKNNLSKYDDFRASASIQNNEMNTQESLSAEYFTQPASLRLDQYSTQIGSTTNNITTLGINTGFAWVGSHGAFTQPITDSFVLVAANNFPDGQELIINPNGTRGEAQLGPRSSTVLKDQTAYYKYLVNLDSTSLPPGYLLEKEYYGIQPTYRSGILISLNFTHKVMVKGRLVKENGEVLSYAAGDVIDAKGRLVDNSFFTNKEGGFLIEGLEPGEYRIVTDRPDLSSVTVQVKESPDSVIDLGNITVKTGGED